MAEKSKSTVEAYNVTLVEGDGHSLAYIRLTLLFPTLQRMISLLFLPSLDTFHDYFHYIQMPSNARFDFITLYYRVEVHTLVAINAKNLVSAYSRRFLTEEDDKFVAISARASRYQAVTGDKMARATQVALLPFVQHRPTRTFSEHLQNIYMPGMDKNKWSVDIVRGLLLIHGSVRRVSACRIFSHE